MLWSGHTDPRLIAADTFRTTEQFRLWLVAQRDAWLAAPITVHWTPRLVANRDLAATIAAVLIGQEPPADLPSTSAGHGALRAPGDTDP